jgi:ribulose-5-phosphate 4-epimerase/fuculose-1-phosphate aldolase
MNSPVPTELPFTLLAARDRCARQGFLTAAHAGISLRLPGSSDFLFTDVQASRPQLHSWRNPPGNHTPPLHRSPQTAPCEVQAPAHHALALHATVYQLRPDVGAILTGGGLFSTSLHELGGTMPVAFDEQARHLGRMGLGSRHGRPAPDTTTPQLKATFANGTNTALIGDLPICLGTTCQRVVLNAELFEKCAQAYVLAAATGQPVSSLPWWVCTIAIGRLRKDQRHAAERFSQGLLPQEARGY